MTSTVNKHTSQPRGAGARALLFVSPSSRRKGRREGRAPAGTLGPHAKNARGVTTGDAGTSRPSLRNGFTAYGALSPGSVALLPPSPCG
ncbi:hypothetical protein B5V03_08330 [Bradyrhizobium betae]|uniref:Uncharacterized protein n=1 Tax=Bradyrhizobium betae TaxID=244734 RepID=A0A4Q1VI15_9BRAD|nr:hypothetical protein B5V03_08330 [Bradyrhizobium betae]